MLIDFPASVAFVSSNILTAVLQFAFLDGNLIPPPPLSPPIISWTTLDFSCPVADRRMTLPASETYCGEKRKGSVPQAVKKRKSSYNSCLHYHSCRGCCGLNLGLNLGKGVALAL